MNDAFLATVARLFVPEMGTESVAPLLYWLVRMTQPKRILEVGMGYTTPFLGMALRDNILAYNDVRTGLPAASDREILADCSYYSNAYVPKLICVDRMSDASSSATQVSAVLDDLGIRDMCEIVEGDLRDSHETVQTALGTIDFAWIDTWDTLAFVRDYWDCIDPAGGILAIHWLMTYPEGRAVLRYIESLRTIEKGKLEILNLREPHKVAQNSLTLIRRTREYSDPMDLRPTGNLKDPPGPLR